MNDFDQDLLRRLAAIRENDLYRELRSVQSPQLPRLVIKGREVLNFSSNDYLGLANDPALKEAAIRAVEKYGAGSGASRLICGSLAPHDELEQALADFKGTGAALVFSSGFAAADGTIGALLGKDDIIVIDKLVHASIVDGARRCGAKLRIFAHNDLDDLAAILAWCDSQRHGSLKPRRVLIVTESVFSMDGDVAPLKEIVGLKEKHGAWLMVDEAHATGILGPRRRGCADELGLDGRIEIQMGTLGKALGSSGGYVCGSRALIDFLINRARSFVFSTAPVPAAAAAARAGIELVRSAAGARRCEALWQRVRQAAAGLAGFAGRGGDCSSAILPLIIGEESKAMSVAAALDAQNLFIPAIRYPTVARGEARLRLTLTAAHSSRDVEQMLGAVKSVISAGKPEESV